jgi:uncharacterized membrane protein YfcA
MGVPPKSAIAMSLAIVGTVSLLGVIPHWKLGNVQIKTAAMFGLSTMLGAYAGAKIATFPFITGTLQMLLFAVMMLLAAIFMMRKSSSTSSSVSEEKLDLALYPKPVCKYCWLWLISEGIGVGILTGLVGVGGGFAIVPALVLLAKVPMKQAIGTSLKIDLKNALGYLIFQCLGAIFAASLLKLAVPITTLQDIGMGTPTLGKGVSPLMGVFMEFILTFFLVFVIFGTAIDLRAPKMGGLFIGLTVTMDILAGGHIIGAAMNPARYIGPALLYHCILEEKYKVSLKDVSAVELQGLIQQLNNLNHKLRREEI